MIDLKNMTIEEMTDLFASKGQKPFHAKQVFRWLYSGVTEFAEMTDISKNLREELSRTAVTGTLHIVRVQQSKKDGTTKFLFGLEDGEAVESVVMKYSYGNSLCISSQAGCRMGCSFCASGINGLKRNLTAGEMTDQAVCAQRFTGERIGHVVIMGTGEPFDNYDEVSRSIRIINCREGLGIGARNITVSTCGLIPVFERFAADHHQVNLAVSLHAPNDELRSQIMPVSRTYHMDELMAACRKYTETTGRRITFEYALIDGFNDSRQCIEELIGRIRGMLCHVNLIPVNPVIEAGMKGTARIRAEQIAAYLEDAGIPATVRRSVGTDIDAACGQLRLKEEVN